MLDQFKCNREKGDPYKVSEPLQGMHISQD